MVLQSFFMLIISIQFNRITQLTARFGRAGGANPKGERTA
jgi:hypothetical protein